MSEILNGISVMCGESSGGLQKIECVPVDFVDSDSFQPVTSAGNLQKAIVITSGDWLTILVNPSERLHNEKFESDPKGSYYSQSVTASIPFETAAIHTELQKMARRRFLLRITERGGENVKMIGTPSHPLKFEFDYSTASNPKGSKGYQIRFYGSTLDRAYFYNPVF